MDNNIMENENMEIETELNEELQPRKKKQMWKDILDYILTAAVTLFIATCVFCVNRVPTGSMEPTIKTNTFIINWRFSYLVGNPTPKHGDIIVFNTKSEDERLLIKRVIGLPGDEISFHDGYVYRNGEKLDEPYVAEEGTTEAPMESYTVPDGCVFVLGDNRQHSGDSRFMSNPYIPINSIYARFLKDMNF